MDRNAQEAQEKTTPSVKARKVKGVVHLLTLRCKGCGFCIEFCPTGVLEFSPEFNAHGYHPPRVAHPDDCTGCDLCGLYCPDFAIYAEMLRVEKPSSAPEEKEK